MANYATLKSTIEDNIKQNGIGAITGPILQSALLSIINSLGAGYQFMGVATPSTNPGTTDLRIFYIASEAGIYSNFGNISVSADEVAILIYATSWTKQSVNFLELTQLFGRVGFPKLRNGSIANAINQDAVCTFTFPTFQKKYIRITTNRPNLSGYSYRYGYALTNNINDVDKAIEYANWQGGIKNQDYSLTDNIIDISSYPSAVGMAIVLAERSDTQYNSLRITNFEKYGIKIDYYDDLEDATTKNEELRMTILQNNKFIGNGNNWARRELVGLRPGAKYRIRTQEKDWDMTGVTIQGSYRLEIYTSYNGQYTTLAYVPIGQDVPDYIDITTPANFEHFYIGGRAATGHDVYFSVESNEDLVDAVEQYQKQTIVDFQSKANDFAELFQGTSGKVETLLFFSDPHWCNNQTTPTISDAGREALVSILTYFKNTPTNFVLSGGDWLNEHRQETAIKDLAEIDGAMNKLFPGMYYPMLGNHDDNYQGWMETQGDQNGRISTQTMINLWFRKFGKMYYDFKGTSSKFYIFDTGIDWETGMTDYRWEQVDWFANKLLENADEHIIVGCHIVSNSGSGFGNITPMATNISLVAQAFNNRGSVTLNGITYNFSAVSTGKVHCILCGHTHYDYMTTLNDIPVYCIKNAGNGDFDLVLLDYGANKLKSIRVGTGSDRTMDLA